MTVLIVDDEKMILDLARRILEKAGFDVVVAENGEEALKYAGQDSADLSLIVVDLALAPISGPDLIRRVREIKPGLPAILSSGHTVRLADLPAEIRDGVELLPKPYRAADLTKLVRKMLRIAPDAG